MGEDPIQTWLGRQATPDAGDPIGSWLGSQRRPAPQTPAPGFFDAFSQAFPRVAGFAEGAAPVVREGIRHAGDIALGAGRMLTTPPSQQAADIAQDITGKYLAGTLEPVPEAIKATTGVDVHGQPIDIAEDLLALGLGGKFLGERAPTGERPVAVRPEAPRAPRGGEATPGRAVEARRPWWDVPALPETGTPAPVEERALPPHEPPGLPPAREPIIPPAPRRPAGLLPERGGGPFESPGEEAPPRINEASRWQRPDVAIATFLEKARPSEPAVPPPVSDADLVAQHFGFKDAEQMRAAGGVGKVSPADLLDPAMFRDPAERPTERAPAAPVERAVPEPTSAPLRGTDAVQDFLARPESTPPEPPRRVRDAIRDYVVSGEPARAGEVAETIASEPGAREAITEALRRQHPSGMIDVYRAGDITPGRPQSWTTDPAVAEKFSRISSEGTAGSRTVTRGRVPVEDVIFPGADSDKELVIDSARVQRGTTPEGEPAATTPMPRNLRDFLVRQLGIPPNEVDAMTPDDARAIGEQVRSHPEGVQAGIRANRRIPAVNPEPVPPLQVAGRGLLNVQARADLMRRTAVPRAVVNVPGEDVVRRVPGDISGTARPPEAVASSPGGVSQPGVPDSVRRAAERAVRGADIRSRTPEHLTDVVPPDSLLASTPRGADLADIRSGRGGSSGSTAGVVERGSEDTATRADSTVNVSSGTYPPTVSPPRRTIAQRLTAGETLTEAERAQAGLPPSEPPTRTQHTPSELGTIQSAIRSAARDRARLLEAGTPESLDAYAKSLAEANDRQAQRELVHNRPDAPKRTGRGEILAGGLGPFSALAYAPEAWRQVREMAPDVARAINDLIREPGKPIGRQELRRAPTPGKDIPALMQVAHPNYALPDLWAQIKPDLLAARDAMGDQAPPGVDRAQWTKVTHDLWHGDAIKTIDAYASQARADGRPRAANYAKAMSAQLRGLPTLAERVAEIVTLGKLSPMRARQVFRAAENVLYNRLFIGALDTGILTRSQVLAAMPHLGLRGVVEGLREGRTPEGERAAESVTQLSPTDTPLSKKISNNAVRRVVNLVTNPVGTAHRANRRDTFLSGVKMAREAGASPDDARAFADDLQELVHGSPMSTNPYIRHFGPLRMLSKYPIVMAQYIHSVATHPDPGVRRRGLGFVLGAAGVSGVLGVSLLDYFLPHLKSIGGPMLNIAQDVYDHATGNAGHSLLEDLDPRRGGTALTGRYPEKVYRTVRDVAERGLSTHTKESMQGEPVGETSGIDELANLLGLHTRYGLPDILGLRVSNEADRKAALADAEDFIKQASRDRSISGRLAREDAARGDAAAMQALSPAQRRAFQLAQRETAFQAELRKVPVARRAEFIEKFAGRFAGVQ